MTYKKLDDFLKPREIQITNIQPQPQYQQKQEEPRYEIVGFYRETEFQETPIGKIPREWKLLKLSLVVDKVKGKKPEDTCKDNTYECLPYLEAQVLRGIEAPKYVKPQNGIVVEPGDVVLIWDGSYAGEVFLVKERGVLASTMVKLVPKLNKLNMRYLYYWLSCKGEPLRKQRKGTGIPHVSEQIFLNLPIALPPLEEQWGIAEVLSSVDRAIEAVDRLIQKLEHIKKALMQELLTKGIGHKEYQETPIGKIPREWKLVKLYEITEKIKAGGTPRVSVREYWNGSIPFAKIEDLKSKYVYSTSTTISELGLKNSNAWIIPERSLLLAIYGSIGEVAINMIKLATNQAILGIIPKKHVVDVEYLYYWFLYFKPKWRIFAKHTTQPNLTAEIVKNSYVPLPPLEEQMRIADILKSVDDWIESEMKRKEKLERLKRGLMELLLTGRVRVKVVSLNSGIPSGG